MHFLDSAARNLGTVHFTQLGLIIWGLILLALVFDFLNGFHDAANSVATVVSTRVLSPHMAVIWAAFFNFIAFLVFHLKVAATMGKGIIDPDIVDNRVIAATLLAACAWDIITWYWGLPTSSSHALIGGMLGAALVKSGFAAWQWEGIGKTVMFILLAPMIGFLCGSAIIVAVTWIFHKRTPRRVDHIFRKLQLVSASFYSLGHGGNDAQKTMGIIFLLLLAATRTSPGLWTDEFKLSADKIEALGKKEVPESVLAKLKPLEGRKVTGRQAYAEELRRYLATDEAIQFQDPIIKAAEVDKEVPTEVVLACHIAMGLGTLFGGWRIVKTMGQRIIRLRPMDGFCAEGGAAITLIMTIFGGIPVSTTHTITGAIFGVGSMKRVSAVRWGMAERVIWAWLFTIPVCLFIAALAWWILRALV